MAESKTVQNVEFQREKSSSGECHQKRLSTDNPVPQAKRICRSSKLSISSNESTTSKAPSNSSDLQNVLSTINIPGSPTSIMVGGVSTIPSTSILLSSTSGGSKDPHFKQGAAKPKGGSDVDSNVEMLQAGPLSPIQVDFFHPLAQLDVKTCCPPPIRIIDSASFQIACLDDNGHHVIIGSEFNLFDFNVANDTWSELCEHEVPSSKFALTVYQSRIHLVGGQLHDSQSNISHKHKHDQCTNKIWCLDNKCGWLESSMSPMPRKLCSATAVGKDNIFLVVDLPDSGRTPYQAIAVDVYKEGSWINTIRMYEAGCPFEAMQLTIHKAHLFIFSIGKGLRKLRSSAISNFTQSGQLTWKDSIGMPRNVIEELYEPNSRIEFWCMSNPVFFCNSVIVLIIGNDRQTLAFYVHHHGKWRREFVASLPSAIGDPTARYIGCSYNQVRIVALPRQVMVITNNGTFIVSFKVPPYCSTDEFTYQSLTRLESAGIPVMTELRQKRLLNQFKMQAGFDLRPVGNSSSDPVRKHICSWLLDNRQRELTRKPTWINFIQALKEVGLPQMAVEIEDFFVQTKTAGENRPHVEWEETVTDKIAILQSQLDLLRKEVDEMQEPILQQPIIKKLDACSSLCSNAFRHLGEEKKGFMDTIKSLQDENQKLKESVQQQAQLTTQQHTPPMLKLLLKALYSTVANKWEDIGILLDIEDGKLAMVKADNPVNSGNCLREMLRIWLKKVDPQPASWKDLVDALTDLGEEKLAQQLKVTYCS